jgi:hypothetical protein
MRGQKRLLASEFTIGPSLLQPESGIQIRSPCIGHQPRNRPPAGSLVASILDLPDIDILRGRQQLLSLSNKL